MKILGIETSCDETSVAIVEEGTKVHANVIASQALLHSQTGGVVPEVAAREHVRVMPFVLDQALEDAKMSWNDIDAIAVTKGPGLVGSLLVGLSAAKMLAYAKQKTLLGVNHIEGHIYGNWLEQPSPDAIQFPVVILTVSGGHNELILMRGHGDFELIGETLDDAAGEAFDKVARLLNLGYPGGPAISKVALNGNPQAFPFPRAWLMDEARTRPKQITNFNFSFSGLKTAVRRTLLELQGESPPPHSSPPRGEVTAKTLADIAASFEEAVVDVMTSKLLAAALKFQVKEVHLAGGVSANRRLRSRMDQLAMEHDLRLRYPEKIVYCTDNAAMIAAAGYFHLQKGEQDDFKMLEANPGLRLVRKQGSL